MKKILALAFIVISIYSCNNADKAPDVSDITVNIPVQRFDVDFFAADTNQMVASLEVVNKKYPEFTPAFLKYIIGLNDTAGIKNFYRLHKSLADSASIVFKNFEPIQKEIETGYKYVKYYFPGYKIPDNIKTVVGPMNSIGDMARMTNGDFSADFIGPDFAGISLQFYLGNNFSLYSNPYFVNNVAPLYKSRRFSKEYIAADLMKLVVDDMFPDKSSGKPLIEIMIEKGKQWFLLDKFLPNTPNSLKTGFTKKQINWCNENEGQIWSQILSTENINAADPVAAQTYIGEAPFTQGMPEASPGNIGQWVGWQIVKKFAKNNPELTPAQIMNTEARKILDEAKYKPK